MFEYVVYFWSNGAYISGIHNNFYYDLQTLINSFGMPIGIVKSKFNSL